MIGTAFAHYRITAALGAGGMGEVWRATDSKLGREVALKVLPDDFAADPERLARFEREARTLAALNHANIATLHALEHLDGRHVLVMELVEGEGLDDLIARGPIPVEEALPIALQIAEGLEAAHQAGIVHRDLKPANVRIRPDGTVKVLDFGLAKAWESEGISGSASLSPTITQHHTRAGVILGTAGYMSPEQARGKPVDKRADIWAFGVVLFEMLTGGPLFTGETLTDVLASVTREEPDWSALPAVLPEPVRRLLRRCLTRDPRQRLQAIAEARIALEAASTGAADHPPSERPRARRLAMRAALLGLSLLALGSLLGYAVGRHGRSGSPGGPAESRFQQLTFGRGTLWSARFAPDGQTVVYSAAWDGNPVRLFLTRLDSTSSSPMSLPDAHLLSISSTGELAISLSHRFDGFMGSGTLARAPLLGTGARPLLEAVREADWTPDGAGLAIVRRLEGRERLEFPIGNVLYETEGWISHIRFSAGGDRIAFADHPIWSDDIGSVAVVDLQGNKRSLTPFSGDSLRGVAWSPSGEEVWYTVSAAEANGVNAVRAVDMEGHVRTLLTGMVHVVLYDVSHSGRLLLGHETTDRRVQARVAGSDQPRDFTLPRENTVGGTISEDGRQVLVSELTDRNYSAYLWPADGSPPVRLGEGYAYAFSPDGKWVLALTPEAQPRILLHPTGTGESRSVPNPTGLHVDLARWTTDGTALIAFASARGERSRGWLLDPDGRMPPRAFTPEGVGTTSNASLLVVSPDGKRIVAGDGKGGYAAYPLAGGAAEPVPALRDPDVPLQWTDDGKALFVARSGEATWNVRRLDLATGAETPWITIAPRETAGLRLSELSISRNGRYWIRGDTRLLVDLYVAEGIR